MWQSPHTVDNSVHMPALALLVSYARDKLGVWAETFVARIGMNNARSIALPATFGFGVIRTVVVIYEVKMRFVGTWGHELDREASARVTLVLGN